MVDREQLEKLFGEHGYTDFRWIEPTEIVVAQWVRMKCTFGCSNYGRNASCPPNTPSVAECREFFDEYGAAAMFHFEKTVDSPEDRRRWSRGVNTGLLNLERAVFLSGYRKAFLIFMDCCRLCAGCTDDRSECKNPLQARPAAEAMAVDVFSTARKYGYPIGVLTDYSDAMNRYALLMIE